MNIEILGKKSSVKTAIDYCIRIFIKELKLQNSRYDLIVVTDRGMAKREGNRGVVFKLAPKTIAMTIDTALDVEKLIITLAHEMVHVKQYAKGQITHGKNVKLKYWMGKPIKADYFDTPWEMEAYSKERILANKIFAKLEKKRKKK
jgi:hypothetical protein